MESSSSSESRPKSTIMTEPEPLPSTSRMAAEEEKGDDKMGFHVNTRLIQQANLEENSELQGLGLSVFDQQEFEDGVMAQVDDAMVKEEENRLRRILEREMKAVDDDFSMATQELTHIEKVLDSMPDFTEEVSRDVRRTIETIKKQRENKLKHLKKLESRKNVLQGKMDTVELDAAMLVGGGFGQKGGEVGKGKKKKGETDREKMIRLGHMTPFGTVIKTEKKTKKDTNKGKHKLPKASSTNGSAEKRRKPNRFDEKDHRVYDRDTDYTQAKYQRKGRTCNRLNHEFSGERASYEEEGMYHDSGDEYVPDNDVYQPESEDDDDGMQTKKEKKSPQKRAPSVYDENGYPKMVGRMPKKLKVKKDTSIKKAKDDGCERFFQKRLKEHQRDEMLKKLERQGRREQGEEVSEDEDEEFDGGLKVPASIWHNLYQYQQVGVRWLWELHSQEAGGIVGDEMGLGKTIQAIAFLAALKYSKLRNSDLPYSGLGPCVIVCPATVMHQWVKEFHKWWPPFKVAILHSSGSHTGRDDELVHSIVRDRGVLITSFSTLVNHQDFITPYNWHYVMLDEGHKIRNPDAQITLACKQFKTPHRVILSGSPIQNNLKELWSLFDFIFPGKLGMLPDFMQHFSVPIVQGGYANATQVQVETAYKCATVLRDTINPFLLRRMKADVKSNINLPQKNEQVLFCRLTDEQRDVYKEYLDSRECQAILSGKFMIFAGLITLRKICNHPDLSTGGPRVMVGEDTGGDPELEYGFYKRSGKMIVVESLLKLWKTQDQRVLLFSQSRAMLDILEEFVQIKKYTYMRIDGTTPISARQQLIDTYNRDRSIYIFLLTTRVGGLGVNLTGANRVIIFDPDWNPSTDTQARERAWRIGQTRQVTIYRLLTSGTIEEKIYHRQIFKQFLTNRVLNDPKQRRFFKSNDIFELFTLADHGDDGGTETSAIFAGTGSNVSVPKLVKATTKEKTKVNRFDEMKIKKEQIKKEDSFEKSFDTDELDRMREMAKMLSKKMEDAKSKSNGESSLLNGSSHKTSSSVPKEKSRSASASMEEKMLSKKEKKKKKHKRKKDAKFEGERIPHLDRQKAFKTQETEEKKNDDYVLRQLFKKTGIHGALQHDKIMSSGHADFALVEAEAEKVANQAVAALRKSRSQCHRATSGIPNWTGQMGGKPRFGKKKNSLLATKPKSETPPPPSPSTVPSSSDTKIPDTKEDKMFDGSLSGSVALTSKAAIMSSNDLLSKMRSRHNLSKQADEDIGGDPDKVDTQDLEIMTDMRNYIAFQCHVDGQASTHELLEQFATRLPKSGAPRFKAMLNKICDLEKSSGVGIWRLKHEFR